MIIIKKTLRWIIYFVLIILLLMMMIAGIISFIIFPNIHEYKDDISEIISNNIGLKTTIGDIVTDWDSLSPRILIKEIDIYDDDNDSALHLENVKGTFSWLSIPTLSPHLSDISIQSPKLHVHRKSNGNVYVAGILLAGKGKPDFANWALTQANIHIKNASIIWLDDLRQAPELSLNRVDLQLRNPALRKILGQHMINLSAIPSVGTNQPINIDGRFYGKDVADLESWHGEITVDTQDVDLTAWKPWIDYPIALESGAGNANVSVEFSENNIDKLVADIALEDVAGKVAPDSRAFDAEHLSGIVSWEQDSKTTTITARDLALNAEKILNIENGSGFFSRTIKNGKPWINASVELNRFDLDFLQRVTEIIKLPETIAKPIIAISPKGKLNNTVMTWVGEPDQPSQYNVRTGFKSLSVKPYKNVPGFKNLSGQLDANEENGALTLAAQDAELDLKDILRWPIPADKLDGKISWRKNKEQLKIVTNDILIANKHISGTVNASYDMNGIKGGYLDLTGEFDNGKAEFAPFYYPLIMGKATMDWLDSSIISGKANDVKVIVKGNLEDFPYIDKKNNPDPNQGIFKVTAKVEDAVLEYGKSWPRIEGIGLDMLFEGNSMKLNADKGRTFGLKISNTEVTIPKLNTYGANAQVLTVTGEAEGPTADGVKFVNLSPVKEVALGFTDQLETAGNGKLKLELSIPLYDVNAASYKGAYQVNNGTMYANDNLGLPEISNINGVLNFDKNGLNAESIQAVLLGGPVQFDIETAADNTIHINGNGNATGAGIHDVMQNTFTHAITGDTDWSATIAIKKPMVNLSIQSNLSGLAIGLPSPLGKTANQSAEFKIVKTQNQADQDQFEINYNENVAANIIRAEQNGALVIDRGDIAINMPPKLPEEPGLMLHGKFGYVNADDWLAITNGNTNDNETPSLTLNKIDIAVQQLDIFNRSLNGLSITGSTTNNRLLMAVNGQEINGDIEWQSAKTANDDGKLVARLKKLHIPESNKENDEKSDDEIKRQDKKYPALDVIADDFKLGEKKLGRLALNAYEKDEDWEIQSLKISSPDHILLADGTWHNWTRSPNTNLKFSLTANDIGNTLDRFGYPDTVKGGVALISGRLKWAGSPHDFKKDGLAGEFRIGASKGQVLKVKPGVGRLFGLLTLQSLPRRLTLDFRDLFSEGFAFDEISGTATISQGIMHSDDFFMTGPAAETEIKGDINLAEETQNLHVKVIPHVSDSVSLAALAGGPIAGVAAFVAQKILKDPLNKIAQSEYTIAGTWDEPIELDAPSAENTQENSPLNVQ